MKNVYLLEVDFGNFVISILCRHIDSRRDGASIGGANPSKQEPEIRHSVTFCWLTAKILSYPTCSEFDQWSLQKKKKLCSWTWQPRSTSWEAHWPGCCSWSGSWSWFSHSISPGREGDGEGDGPGPSNLFVPPTSRQSWIRDKSAYIKSRLCYCERWGINKNFKLIFKAARLSQILCLRGAYLSQILKLFTGRSWWFHQNKGHNRDICLTRDKSAYYHQLNVPPQKAVCAPACSPCL